MSDHATRMQLADVRREVKELRVLIERLIELATQSEARQLVKELDTIPVDD